MTNPMAPATTAPLLEQPRPMDEGSPSDGGSSAAMPSVAVQRNARVSGAPAMVLNEVPTTTVPSAEMSLAKLPGNSTAGSRLPRGRKVVAPCSGNAADAAAVTVKAHKGRFILDLLSAAGRATDVIC